ncbi:MAG: AAA family ATPase, partial [Clostridiales bacterium]|nr:AAA family ATPase [Clostridiales bacterium]
KLSVLRNRNLANVFYRLGFVEIFGTGILRIKQLYEEGVKQPEFEVSENTIKIALPVFEKDLNLSEDERMVYQILSKTVLKSISEIAPHIPFGKSKTTQLLKDMEKKGVVKIEGRGRGTKYVIK